VVPFDRSERQEQKLRELAAWYEWSEPPNLVAAAVLQDAADAVRTRALSGKAADALIAVWQPFVGLEARVGNPPPTVRAEDVKLRMLRRAVDDLKRWLAEAPEDSGARFAELLAEQERILEGYRGSC
jgi:hypothetical protein